MPRGGRRANAGRKLAPAAVAFREFWREWLQSEAGRRHLIQRVKHSDAILAKIIDKVFPTPQAVDTSADDARPIRITVGPPGHELHLGGMKPRVFNTHLSTFPKPRGDGT